MRMALNLLCKSLLVTVGVVLCGSVTSASEVSSLRLASQADKTRVVLELSQVTQQKVFTLESPDRVVIDLPGARMQGALPAGDGVVKQVRAAKRDSGDLRVVLDVTAKVTPRVLWLEPEPNIGPRLVVDLMLPGTSAKPVTATPATTPATVAPAMPAPVAPDSATGTTAVPAAPAVPATSAAPAEPPSAVAPTSATTPLPVKTLAATVGGRDLIIAIDAGHGGEDPGAIGRRGLQEKKVTLAIAHLLKKRIDAEPGMRAVLTRDADVFVPLRERINRARQQQADMFISIHADSVANSTASGSSVYTLSSKGATNEAARFLADRENAADLVGGVSLDNKNGVLASVLLDLTQGASMSASMDAAGRVLKQLDRIGDTHHSQVQQAGFVVLKSPDIPSMLVETAFISNPLEEVRLGDPDHQSRIAEAVLSGVRDYFANNTPPGTRLAQLKAARQARAD